MPFVLDQNFAQNDARTRAGFRGPWGLGPRPLTRRGSLTRPERASHEKQKIFLHFFYVYLCSEGEKSQGNQGKEDDGDRRMKKNLS
jgi:hypothetical protein